MKKAIIVALLFAVVAGAEKRVDRITITEGQEHIRIYSIHDTLDIPERLVSAAWFDPVLDVVATSRTDVYIEYLMTADAQGQMVRAQPDTVLGVLIFAAEWHDSDTTLAGVQRSEEWTELFDVSIDRGVNVDAPSIDAVGIESIYSSAETYRSDKLPAFKDSVATAIAAKKAAEATRLSIPSR